MHFVVALKFSHNPHLREKLIKTGDKILIEGNYWHDNDWGDCYCKNCKHTPGNNNLGKILMNVRSSLLE